MDRRELERLRRSHPRQREIDARAAQLLRASARLTRTIGGKQPGEALKGRRRPSLGDG